MDGAGGRPDASGAADDASASPDARSGFSDAPSGSSDAPSGTAEGASSTDASSSIDATSGGGDAADAQSAGTPTSPDCDMNGRWLVAQRVLASALGQTQASHNWIYYEIRQDADQVSVTNGLHCGHEVKHVTALGADVDS